MDAVRHSSEYIQYKYSSPPRFSKPEGKLVQTITGTGRGSILRRHYPTTFLRKKHVQKRRKPARRRRLSRRGWERRSGKASPIDFRSIRAATAAWNQLNRWIERPRHRAAVSEPSGSAAAARRPASLGSCCRNPVCSPLAGQCATSTPALKMILEAADIYSSRCFQIRAAVLVNMSWCRTLASNVLSVPFCLMSSLLTVLPAI